VRAAKHASKIAVASCGRRSTGSPAGPSAIVVPCRSTVEKGMRRSYKLPRMAELKRILVAVILAVVAVGPSLGAADPVKPRIRAITGFVTIDAKSYPAQLQETVTFLSKVRDAIQAAGYQGGGIRISTQPFPEYTRGLSRADGLSLLRKINELAGTLRFSPNIGPAMVKDGDDAASVDLAIDVLSDSGNRLNANLIVAGDDGIHWNA